MGGVKSNYHKERGRETQRREGEGERGGKEINLLIFHGQPLIITLLGALRALRVGQFECVHMHVCVRVCEAEEMDQASLLGLKGQPPLQPLALPCVPA